MAGYGDQTSRTRVFDAARGLDWPGPYTGRALRNAFVDAWDGREADKEGNDDGDARAPQSLTRSSCHFPQNSQPEYYLLAQWRSSPVRVMFT